MQKKIAILGLTVALTTAVFAQKRPIDHTVYDGWKSVTNTEVSKSGQFIYYQITPQEGDGLFQLKNRNNELLFSIPRASDVKLTQGESYLIGTIKPTFDETRTAKIKKKKADDMPKDSLVIVNLQTNQIWKTAHVKSYKLARLKNEYIAYLTEEKKNASVADSLAPAKEKASKEKSVNILTLKNLATGDTLNFWKADQYAWSPQENLLLFSKKNETKDSLSTDGGLYIYDIANNSLKKISNGQGNYKELSFDDQGAQIAFLADKSPEKSLVNGFKLY